METEKTQGTPAGRADQNLMTCAPEPRSAAGETIGRAKGEAIGGAIGHAIGVGVGRGPRGSRRRHGSRQKRG
jgi:hypothetical protein